MKTKFISACLLFSATLMAQVSNLPTVLNVNTDNRYTDRVFGVVPSSLSYDGSNRVYVRTADDEVAVYSNAFAPVKSFNITPTHGGYVEVLLERTVTASVTGGELINSNLTVWDGDLNLIPIDCEEQTGDCSYDVPATWTENDVKSFLESDQNPWRETGNLQESGSITQTKENPNGGVWFLFDMRDYYADGADAGNYWEVETYGKQYPKSAYLWRNGYLYLEINFPFIIFGNILQTLN